jgi:hypothetical protein
MSVRLERFALQTFVFNKTQSHRLHGLGKLKHFMLRTKTNEIQIQQHAKMIVKLFRDFKNTTFWDLIPYSPVQVLEVLKGTHCLHLHGR